MCGILGVLNKNVNNFIDLEDLLVNFIKPRGPDNIGHCYNVIGDYKLSLFHTRLSIIDKSASADQPMLDENSGWVISYNGEIYNYSEIREELISNGWSFKSSSDTEVLLKAWVEWGVSALPRLNGMFAFCVFNKYTGEIWLIRDRFGVKPLVWGRKGNDGFVFSSSISAVAKYVNASVDTEYCAFGLRYKAFEQPEGKTAFLGVNSVEPGSWLRLNLTDGKLTLDSGKWYDLKKAVNDNVSFIKSMSDDEILSKCRALISDAVKIRLRSDVPLAVSLSGGLDSTTVASTSKKQIDELHGFTYGSPFAPLSEGPLVQKFCDAKNITPHYVWPNYNKNELDSLLERTLSCQEAPFPGLSVMAQNEVFRKVRESGYKVLLGGQGGDEIFAGYRKFFVVAARHAVLNKKFSESLGLIYSLGLMLIHEVGSLRQYFTSLNRYSSSTENGFELLNWIPSVADLWGDSSRNLSDRQIEDIQRWSIPTLLRYEDRNSMGNAIESRLPFMDYRLVEFAIALPVHYKIRNGYGKYLVREVTKNIVPSCIRLDRKKRGFDVTQGWIANGLGQILRERILDNTNNLSPYIREKSSIESYLNESVLESNSNIIDEALMLAWLVEPIRAKSIC